MQTAPIVIPMPSLMARTQALVSKLYRPKARNTAAMVLLILKDAATARERGMLPEARA